MEATAERSPQLNVDKILAHTPEDLQGMFSDPEAMPFENFLKYYVDAGGLSNRNYIKLINHYNGVQPE